MSNATILIIDDEPQIQRMLAISLGSLGHRLLEAETGKMGLLMAANHAPDLILLDLGLPDQSGHAVLKELRKWYNHAIIILSVRSDEADIVQALDQGATDYLTKPFRMGELQARIRAAMRGQQAPDKQVLTFGDIEIDLPGHVVTKGGKSLKLTVTEFNLLALFARNQGRVLTHQYILKEVWGVGAQTETQYLRVFVGTLRKKIESDPRNPQLILTESGVGYRFQG